MDDHVERLTARCICGVCVCVCVCMCVCVCVCDLRVLALVGL